MRQGVFKYIFVLGFIILLIITYVVFYSKKATPPTDNSNPKSAKTKEAEILPYLLICHVNDRINNNFKMDTIKWAIRIFSDNMLSFVKDTSKVQHYIIDLLAGPNGNLFMVGDEDQSIYRFRAAYPKALIEFTDTYINPYVMFLST